MTDDSDDNFQVMKVGKSTLHIDTTDDTGILKVDVSWDSGSNLSLLDGIDEFEYWWLYPPAAAVSKQ